MAGKLTAAQGTGVLLVTANVGSLFEDVSVRAEQRAAHFTPMLCFSYLSVCVCVYLRTADYVVFVLR